MSQIESLLDRPKSYYNIDGVGELSAGFMAWGYALLQWMQVHSPKDSAWNRVYMLFIYVGVMCSIIHYGSKAIKKHITYPRTGFVQYRKRDTAWRPLLMGMVVSMLASIALIRALRSGWEITTPASLTGLLFAAAYAFGIARSVPWKWAVVCLMVTGSLVIAVLPAGLVGALANDSWITADFPPQAVGAFLLNFMLFGTLLLVSGGASFWLYLRDTRPPVQEAS